MSDLVYRRALSVSPAFFADPASTTAIDEKVQHFLATTAKTLTVAELRKRVKPQRMVYVVVTVVEENTCEHTHEMQICTSPPRCPLCGDALP